MTYRTKFWMFAALALGAAAIVGLIIGNTVSPSGGTDNSELLLPALLGLASLLVIPAWLWWRRTDDLQQQSQMISWWWGGSAGALTMFIVLIVMTGRHSDLSTGAFYMFGAQLAGMVLFWVGWTIRGRGKAE